MTADKAAEALKLYFSKQCSDGLARVKIEAFAPDGDTFRVVSEHKCKFDFPQRHEIIMLEDGSVAAIRKIPLFG
jgi:hypothetical protein